MKGGGAAGVATLGATGGNAIPRQRVDLPSQAARPAEPLRGVWRRRCAYTGTLGYTAPYLVALIAVWLLVALLRVLSSALL